MYLEHFGVKEFPFSITPDTSYFFSSGASQEALNTLLFAVRSGEGFIKITGEVGTGKSLLCRKLMASLEGEFKIAYIPNPYLEPHALFMELASELELDGDQTSGLEQHQLLKMLTLNVLKIIQGGKRVLICLDETQAMPIVTLEALRLLTNIETEKRKLLQVVIFGQPELEDKLNHPSIRQLKQRIAFHYHLTPLTRKEIDYYVHHRLKIAGYHGGKLFSPMALLMLQIKSKRVPRLVNILAHKAMLSAFGKKENVVSMFDVIDAANDTDSLRKPNWVRAVQLFLLLLIGSYLAYRGWMYLQ